MAEVNRRKFLGTAAAVAMPAAAQMKRRAQKLPDVVVVGAGIFGACSAYFLRRQGHAVTLLDAWGVGHPRATSAGESRIIRAGYGTQALYTRWAWAALRDWKQWQQEWRTEIFCRTGVLWLASEETEYTAASVRHLAAEKIPCERLGTNELQRRYPQIAPLATRFAYFEPEAGVLLARKATRAVVAAFELLGGRFFAAQVNPPAIAGARLDAVSTAAGERLTAAAFVFACGPWLPRLFPALLGGKIAVSKQEVYFFGVPAGSSDFEPPRFPAWVDLEERIGYYGIPALEGRGVKIASDHSGPPFDPTSGDRSITPEGVAAARRYLGLRLPALKDAPLAEARVCQYERTRDSHLILDRHPGLENVWIAGGGSGHGFKLGPSVGRAVAECVGDRQRDRIPRELRVF